MKLFDKNREFLYGQVYSHLTFLPPSSSILIPDYLVKFCLGEIIKKSNLNNLSFNSYLYLMYVNYINDDYTSAKSLTMGTMGAMFNGLKDYLNEIAKVIVHDNCEVVGSAA